jgi:hypothetical protein
MFGMLAESGFRILCLDCFDEKCLKQELQRRLGIKNPEFATALPRKGGCLLLRVAGTSANPHRMRMQFFEVKGTAN